MMTHLDKHKDKGYTCSTSLVFYGKCPNKAMRVNNPMFIIAVKPLRSSVPLPPPQDAINECILI